MKTEKSLKKKTKKLRVDNWRKNMKILKNQLKRSNIQAT